MTEINVYLLDETLDSVCSKLHFFTYLVIVERPSIFVVHLRLRTVQTTGTLSQ